MNDNIQRSSVDKCNSAFKKTYVLFFSVSTLANLGLSIAEYLDDDYANSFCFSAAAIFSATMLLCFRPTICSTNSCFRQGLFNRQDRLIGEESREGINDNPESLISEQIEGQIRLSF